MLIERRIVEAVLPPEWVTITHYPEVAQHDALHRFTAQPLCPEKEAAPLLRARIQSRIRKRLYGD